MTSISTTRYVVTACLSVALTATCSACAVLLDFEEARERAAISTDDSTTTDATTRITKADVGRWQRPQGDADASGARSDAEQVDAASMDATSEKIVPPSCGTCVGEPPTGWQGPLAIYEGLGDAPASLPSCGDTYPLDTYEGVSGPVAPAAQCACTCDAPLGVACSDPVVTYFSNNTCTFGCNGSSAQDIGSTCTPLTNGWCSGPRMSVSGSTASGGSCAPVASKLVAALAWNTSVRLCAAPTPQPQATCAAGNVCAPQPSLPFNTQKVCIARAGDWSCPAAYPTLKRYHDSATDTRSCSACSCGSPAGSTCTGSISTYRASDGTSGNQCTTPKAALTLPVDCGSVGSADRGITVVAPSGGSCSPSGGAPIGDVTPGVAMTVCCVE